MQKAKPDIVVVGGANTDCLIQGKYLPQPGESVDAHQFYCLAGGKGVSQAIAAARLGARVALIAMLGNDRRGEEILDRLAAEGVDSRYVLRTVNAATGATSIMINAEGETLRMWAPGANRLLLPEELDSAATLIGSAGLLLTQLEIPLPAVRHALRLARNGGIRTMVDAAPATALEDAVLALTDILRANADEASTLTGMAVSDHQSAVNAARQLLARGVGVAALESGDSGNLVMTSDALHAFSRLPVQARDRTGAGDAYTACLAVSLLEGRGLEEAAQRANAAAAYAIGWIGALGGLPSKVELEAFLASRTSD